MVFHGFSMVFHGFSMGFPWILPRMSSLFQRIKKKSPFPQGGTSGARGRSLHTLTWIGRFWHRVPSGKVILDNMLVHLAVHMLIFIPIYIYIYIYILGSILIFRVQLLIYQRVTILLYSIVGG